MTKKKDRHLPSTWKPLCFTAALIERMYLNYWLFDEAIQGNGASVYRSALDLVWEYLSVDNVTINFDKQHEKLERVTPDPDDFDFYGVWPALDACVALSMLLEACAGNDECHTEVFIKLTRSTISAYLDTAGYEGDFDRNELMLEHHAYCHELDRLLEEPNSKREIVKSVKILCQQISISNLGISASN